MDGIDEDSRRDKLSIIAVSLSGILISIEDVYRAGTDPGAFSLNADKDDGTTKHSNNDSAEACDS